MSKIFSINGLNLPNSINLSVMIFPGGEPHVKLFDYVPENSDFKNSNISVRLNSFEDVGKLLALDNALKNANGNINTLLIPYFPGARQDKPQAGEAFTVELYAQIINNIQAKKVVICDPHSEITTALIKNVQVLSQVDIWQQWIQEKISSSILPVVFISPDIGASKKTCQLANGVEVIQCLKNRNSKTGRLSNFVVQSNSLIGKHGILIDDICDGGGTFLGLAQELRSKNIEKLTLGVTHGIFSKGIKELQTYYDEIVTTNSIRENYEPTVTVLDLGAELFEFFIKL